MGQLWVSLGAKLRRDAGQNVQREINGPTGKLKMEPWPSPGEVIVVDSDSRFIVGDIRGLYIYNNLYTNQLTNIVFCYDENAWEIPFLSS